MKYRNMFFSAPADGWNWICIEIIPGFPYNINIKINLSDFENKQEERKVFLVSK